MLDIFSIILLVLAPVFGLISGKVEQSLTLSNFDILTQFLFKSIGSDPFLAKIRESSFLRGFFMPLRLLFILLIRFFVHFGDAFIHSLHRWFLLDG
jgi:hypothetical protein